MKLYTENDLKRAMKRAYLGGMSPFNLLQVRTEILEQLTPIELPSDEEIEKQAEHEDTYSKKCAFTRGAKWMWRKTFRGNK